MKTAIHEAAKVNKTKKKNVADLEKVKRQHPSFGHAYRMSNKIQNVFPLFTLPIPH